MKLDPFGTLLMVYTPSELQGVKQLVFLCNSWFNVTKPFVCVVHGWQG